jgi:transposase
MLVIELCKEHDTEFQIGVKKYIWQKIAREISEKTKTSVTPQQCDTKLKRLKITYKQVKKHNASSGNARKQWVVVVQYYVKSS